MTRIRTFLKELIAEIRSVVVPLFWIMIPTIIVVKILDESGVTAWLGVALRPVMALVGLPEGMGIVWASTILTNLYTGMLVFATQAESANLTVAQVTVLGTLMLVAHALPVECRIAQKSGVPLIHTIVLRLLGAIVLGMILHWTFHWGGWLQQPNEMFWKPDLVEPNLAAWTVNLVKSLGVIVVIITVLVAFLKLLKILHIERLLSWLLGPVLRSLGIGRDATTITIIGLTLGISYGGGLLIKEASAGHVSRRDVFTSMSLLCLAHSVIEDTMLIALLGAHLSGIFWARLLFAWIVIALLARWTAWRSDDFRPPGA